jgi:hypothetical protein
MLPLLRPKEGGLVAQVTANSLGETLLGLAWHVLWETRRNKSRGLILNLSHTYKNGASHSLPRFDERINGGNDEGLTFSISQDRIGAGTIGANVGNRLYEQNDRLELSGIDFDHCGNPLWF